jgi:hypothetical protein
MLRKFRTVAVRDGFIAITRGFPMPTKPLPPSPGLWALNAPGLLLMEHRGIPDGGLVTTPSDSLGDRCSAAERRGRTGVGFHLPRRKSRFVPSPSQDRGFKQLSRCSISPMAISI